MPLFFFDVASASASQHLHDVAMTEAAEIVCRHFVENVGLSSRPPAADEPERLVGAELLRSKTVPEPTR